MERVNKLKESELAEYMEQANEQYSKVSVISTYQAIIVGKTF